MLVWLVRFNVCNVTFWGIQEVFLLGKERKKIYGNKSYAMIFPSCLIDFSYQTCSAIPKFSGGRCSRDVLLGLSRLSIAQFKLMERAHLK